LNNKNQVSKASYRNIKVFIPYTKHITNIISSLGGL
jgi:hypothetical protein